MQVMRENELHAKAVQCKMPECDRVREKNKHTEKKLFGQWAEM